MLQLHICNTSHYLKFHRPLLQLRKLNYLKTGKELSEIKSFGTVKQYFNEIYRTIFKSKIVLNQIVQRIVTSIERYGVKSVKKGKKTPFLILQNLKKSKIYLAKIAS